MVHTNYFLCFISLIGVFIVRLFNQIITSIVFFAIISAPFDFVSAAPGILDSPSNTAYTESRDLSQFVKPAIGLGALIIVGGVIALSSGGHHSGGDSSSAQIIHAH